MVLLTVALDWLSTPRAFTVLIYQYHTDGVRLDSAKVCAVAATVAASIIEVGLVPW
jgi:hypothetical protein